MKSIVKKISSALQVILMAPVKLPAKIVGIVKYLALGLGIVESVLDGDEKPDSEVTKESPKLVEDRTDKDQQPDQAALGEESTMPENNTDRDPQIKKAKLSEESALLEETSELHDPGKGGQACGSMIFGWGRSVVQYARSGPVSRWVILARLS